MRLWVAAAAIVRGAMLLVRVFLIEMPLSLLHLSSLLSVEVMDHLVAERIHFDHTTVIRCSNCGVVYTATC